MPKYTIEVKGLDKFVASFRKAPKLTSDGLIGAIKTSVNLIRPIMVREAPAKTGKLRQNIYARSNGLTGTVGPDLGATKYALYVHMGTRQHLIKPRTKKALYWKGALHPVKVVHHPGTRANPFVERTVDIIKDPVQQIFTKALNKILINIS